MNAKPAADLLVRAARVRTMDPAAGPVTTLAIRDGKIAVWDAYEDTEAMFNCGPWR